MMPVNRQYVNQVETLHGIIEDKNKGKNTRR